MGIQQDLITKKAFLVSEQDRSSLKLPLEENFSKTSIRIKRSFTLLEILICFSLLTIGVTGLYSLIISISTSTQKIERNLTDLREELSYRRTIRKYLSSLLLTSKASGRINPFFYTEGENGTDTFQVYTCCNNHIDFDPALSNEIVAKLYIDEKNTFKITLFSHPKISHLTPKEATIDLFPNISSMLWEFALWKTKATQNPNNIEKPPEGVWMQNWKREWNTISPHMIRLTLFPKGDHKKPIVITSINPEGISPPIFEKSGG